MDLSIITVTYQSREYIDGCILSVLTHTLNIQYEHIIVDNGSTDGTAQYIEQNFLNYVHLIKNRGNLGFAKANQIGVNQAKGRYILFLNPDMQIDQGHLDTLIGILDREKTVGALSCKLVNSERKPHPALRPSHFPSLSPYFFSFLGLTPFFCTVHKKFQIEGFDDDKEQEVELVRGAFLLMRREIIETLGFAFNPIYYILFEDVDTCQEIARLGWKILYTPSVTCIDYFGRSFLAQPKPWKVAQMKKSFITYVSRWHSPLHLLWIYPLFALTDLFRKE